MANQPKKYKKFVATAATATLVASAIVPVASAASFSDVSENSEFAPYIDALVEEGIINGYSDGTFKPGASLTRGQVVKMLGRWVESQGVEIPSDWNSKQRFSDVPVNHKDAELVKYAALVKDSGVFTGAAGKLQAGNNITRQQMAKVLNGAYAAVNEVSLIELAENVEDVNVRDLFNARAEFEDAIQALMDLEISTTASGNFRPTENVTRAQFAKFLYNTINLEPTAVSYANVKAINNTTVEVTFPEEVDNLKNLDFAIEGLDVKNAVLKQGSKSTVVLTTAAQEVGKQYTVLLNEEEIGTFIGIEAVVPTSVNITEKSLQAAVGTQVTLKAQVTVKEGQSKENIPVTFNIVNNHGLNTTNLNQPIVVEALTNADGVATYTYTRYAQTSYQIASHDEVQAYATGNPTARSFSKVYWASIQPLTLTEVTEGSAIQNGGKKVYKVTAATEHVETITAAEYAANVAYYNAKGVYSAGDYVNVGYQENTDVTPDKAVKTIDVIDATGRNLGYPGQYTTSTSGSNSLNTWVKEVKIKLDNNGQAIFTLSGLNGEVTPYVFVDQKVNPANDKGTSGRFEATELFAKAAKVTFGKQHTLGLTLEALGEQYAAAFYNNDADYIANNLETYVGRTLTADELKAAVVDAGGRDYKITVKDSTGKLAPIGTRVGIDVKIGSALRQNGGAVYLVDNNTRQIHKLTADAANNGKGVEYSNLNLLTTDAKGEVSFTLIGYKDAYATPTVVIDSGDEQGKVDKNDQKVAGDIVYFSDARVTKAVLTASKASVSSNESVEFTYQTVDQNGKKYRPLANGLNVNNPNGNNVPITFQVSTTFNAVDVKPGKGSTGFINVGSQNVTVGQDSMGNFSGVYETFTIVTDQYGTASVIVSGKGLGTTVNVTASASIASLPQLLTASAEFVATSMVPANYSGQVASFNTADKTLTFGGKVPVSYANATYFYNNTVLDETGFITALKNASGAVLVNRTVDATGTKFTILNVSNTGVAPVEEGTQVPTPGATALAAALKKAEALDATKYTAESYKAVTDAVAAAKAATTDAAKGAAAQEIEKAIAALKDAPVAGENFTFTSKTATPNATIGVLADYNIVGTIANTVGEVASVKIVLKAASGSATDALDVTYNATDRKFEFVTSNAKAASATLKAYDASGKELASTEITF